MTQFINNANHSLSKLNQPIHIPNNFNLPATTRQLSQNKSSIESKVSEYIIDGQLANSHINNNASLSHTDSMSPKMMDQSQESFQSQKDSLKQSRQKRVRRSRQRSEFYQKQRQKQNVSPGNGWFQNSFLFDSKQSKIKGNGESSGLAKIRNRRNANINLQTYEVQNLLGMVENMYEKALHKKTSLSNITTDKQINSQHPSSFIIQNQNIQSFKEQNKNVIQIEKLRQRKVQKDNMKKRSLNQDDLCAVSIEGCQYSIDILDENDEQQRSLSRTQRVSIQILPQDQQGKICCKQEENRDIFQNESEVIHSVPINNQETERLEKQDGKILDYLKEQKKICNERQKKRRQYYMESKFSEVLKRKQSQKIKERDERVSVDLKRVKKYKEHSHQNSQQKFAQKSSFLLTERLSSSIKKQETKKHSILSIEKTKNKKSQLCFDSNKKSKGKIIQPSCLEQKESKQIKSHQAQKPVLSSMGVYESVLSGYSTAKLIAIYNNNEPKLNNCSEKDWVKSGKTQTRAKSLNLKQSKEIQRSQKRYSMVKSNKSQNPINSCFSLTNEMKGKNKCPLKPSN